MSTSDPYYMLVASLPQLPQGFDAGNLPITRASLRKRLNLLREEDRRVVNQVAGFFVWDRQPLDRTDADVIATYRHLMESVDNLLVRRIINHRINMRTIVSALRKRKFKDGRPLGVGQLTDDIRRGWNQPNLGLQNRYQWIEPFSKAMERGAVRDAQHILFSDLWKTWTRESQQYYFTFEAVILYLARWEIVDRWASQHEDQGRRRFSDLITETMGEYANLY